MIERLPDGRHRLTISPSHQMVMPMTVEIIMEEWQLKNLGDLITDHLNTEVK